MKKQNFARYGIGGEKSITTLVSILDYFQEKLINFLFKNSKNSNLVSFWLLYAQIQAKRNVSIFYHIAKNRKNPIPKKNVQLL